MSVDITLKHSSVKDKAPTSSDLQPGELAINTNVDSPALYAKDSAGSVIKIAGAGSVSTPDASETVAGIAEIATTAEITTGTDDGRIVSPLKLKQALDALPPGTTVAAIAPATPETGQGWFDTTTNTLNIWDGTAWQPAVAAAAVLWDEGSGGLIPATPGNNVYVGGTAAAPNITLNAADGSASFAGGDVTINSDGVLSATQLYATITGDYAFRVNGKGGYYVDSSGNESLYVRNASDSNPVITLNGAAGSAEFAGGVAVSDLNNGSKDNSSGIKLNASGSIFSGRSGVDTAFAAFNTDSTNGSPNQRFEVRNTGDTYIGGTIPSAPAISLNADGNASFAGVVDGLQFIANQNGGGFVASRSTDGLQVWRAGSNNFNILDTSTYTSEIMSDGSATFAGGNINLYLSGNIGSNRADGSNINLNSGPTYALQIANPSDSSLKAFIKHDGSATFGRLGANDSDQGSVQTFSGGRVQIDATVPTAVEGSSYFLECLNNGDDRFTVKKDGSGTFAGDVKIGGTLPSAPNITLESSSGRIKVNDGLYVSNLSGGQAVSIYNNSGTASTKNALAIANIGGGSPKSIELKYDGSATFAGEVISGDATRAGAYCVMQPNGYIEAVPVSDTDTAFRAFSRDQGKRSFVVEGDGSVYIGGTPPESPNIALNADGSAKFASNTIILYANGSADFKRNVATSDVNPSSLGDYGFRAVWGVDAPGEISYLTCRIAGKNRAFAHTNSTTVTSAIGIDGSAEFTGIVTATVVPPSDARFKENITPAKPQLADVVALGGLLKNYDWTDEAPLNEELRSVRQLGLIAQEVEAICPTMTKEIARTKQGAMLTPEETIPAVYEERVVPAKYETVPVPAKLGPKGRVITPESTEEILVAPEYTEQVLVTPEQVIPATYEVLDDSYKGISSDALIMKLLGAVAELKAEVDALKSA